MTKRTVKVFLSVVLILAVLLGTVSCGFLGVRTLSLEYTLTESDYDNFAEKAAAIEKDAREEASYFRVVWDLNGFTDSYSFIRTQATIAYINYCKDTKSEKAITDHKFATSLSYKAHELYNETLRNILVFDNSVTEMLFSGWTEDEKENLLDYNSEVEALLEKNELLLLEHQALDSKSEGWYAASDPLYKEFFDNNKAIAEHNDYDNYYDYAADKLHNRDYSSDEREKIREYVKTYIDPLYKEIKERRSALFESADAALQKAYTELARCNYDENNWETDYIADYIDGYEGDIWFYLSNMYYSDGMIIGDGENALDTAFTTVLLYYNEPVVYFGKGYRNMLTIVHENGHYASFWQPDIFAQALDVHEIQSQGNEWMFVKYMEGAIDGAIHEMLLLDRLTVGLGNIIYSCAVDEMEEMIYKGRADSIHEAVLAVAEDYTVFDGPEKLEDYFRHVAMPSPVYYISYATSELVSLGLYTIAKEDYNKAKEIYTSLVLDVSSYSGLHGAVDYCGLLDPFDESTFEYIRDVFTEEESDTPNDEVEIAFAA